MRQEDIPDILVHIDDLYRFAFVILGTRAGAEDAVRSVYNKVRDEPRFPAIFCQPANWYFSILVKEIKLRRRLAGKLVENLRRCLHCVDSYWRSSHSPNEDPETKRIIEQLRPLLADEAAAILLHDVFDFAPADSCEILGVSRASFHGLLSNARAGLLRGTSPSSSSIASGLSSQATAPVKVETI